MLTGSGITVSAVGNICAALKVLTPTLPLLDQRRLLEAGLHSQLQYLKKTAWHLTQRSDKIQLIAAKTSVNS